MDTFDHKPRLNLDSGKPVPSFGLRADETKRWLRRHDLAPAPPGRPQGRSWQRAKHPHDTWEVDAADQKRLADGRMICWLWWLMNARGQR